VAETILAKLAVEISAKATQFGKVLSDQEKSLGKFSKSVEGLSSQLKGALGTISIGLLGKEIIDITSQFQKFSAVLTNTLGSSSEAQKALKGIQDFAAKTPFSVQELTASFVKLANQGFKPTTDELRKLGDLASSTGKGFDQLAEAIIDAQTGEFERLKEFGIRAQKQGDQVKFTFKGVETQTKFTSEAIREYVLSLGDAEGVSGSMAAISETLGGKISNLGDAWDNFLLTLGKGSSGPLNAAVESLTQLVNVAANLNSEIQLRLASYGIKNLSDLNDEVGKFALQTARLNGDKLVKDIIAPFNALTNAQVVARKVKDDFIDALEKEGASTEEAVFLWTAFLKVRIESAKADAAAAKQARIDGVLAAKDQAAAHLAFLTSQGLIEKINAELVTLEEGKKKAFSPAEITVFNEKIEKLKKDLEVLNASRFLTNFAKKQLQNAQKGIPTVVDTEQGTGFQRTLDNELPTELPAPNVDLLMNNLKFATDAVVGLSDAYGKLGPAGVQSNAQLMLAGEMQRDEQERQTQAALDFGNAIGNSIAQSIQAEETFAQSMKRVTKTILKEFLIRALGAVISKSFETAKNPILGAVLAGAMTAVVSAMFSKIGGPSKSVSGGARGASEGTRVTREKIDNRQQIELGGKFVVAGKDMQVVLSNQNVRSQRTG